MFALVGEYGIAIDFLERYIEILMGIPPHTFYNTLFRVRGSKEGRKEGRVSDVVLSTGGCGWHPGC
jgi:hypothetical protein